MITLSRELPRLKNTDLKLSSTLYLHLKPLFASLEHVSIHARGRLLDIGCGNKPYESYFASRVEEHVGCDAVQSDQGRVDIICPATSIPLPDASFDTVLCTQVLEHVADHTGLLREASRLLKKGGVLILSAPMYWPHHEEPFDFFRFTKYGLAYLLEETGFITMEVHPNGGKWALAGQSLVHSIVTTRLDRWPLTHSLLIPMINSLFSAVDRRFPNYNNTMNHVVVACKSSTP